ncbi:MAG: hypothetical protein M3Q20_02150 [Actinomycetota bacterium]|nr:hypothetical protein [Actinomycetota bacterium]
MRRRLLVIALVLLAVASTGAPAASAASSGAEGPDIATLDARIERAQAHIDRWYPRIERWYRHIRQAAARVDRLEEIVALSSTDAGLIGGPGGSVWVHRGPSFRLDHANSDLRSTLRSPWARRAQAQLDTWSAYLAELVRARERALRPAPQEAERAGATAPLPGQARTYEGWATAFLGRLGAPPCDENLLIVVTWETSESTSAAYNPLATTHDMPGATDMNTVGVKHYVSLGQGLDASRDTLLLGAESYGYGAVLDSVRSCRSAKVTARAINASAWCRGCVSGAYITGLLPIVRATYVEHAARLVATRP